MSKDSPRDTQDPRGPSGARNVLLVGGIVLVAANLRPALTSVAPLIGEIRTDTGMSHGVAGLLTTLPLLAFGLLSSLAPRLARRFGMGHVLLASLLALAAGIVVRSVAETSTLFLGTAILGAAIAMGNVLLPALVKEEFPGRAGLMTSVYSTALSLCATFAAGVSLPLAHGIGLGWRGGLAVWAVPALVGATAWLPRLRNERHRLTSTSNALGAINLWRSPLAWQVTLFMGLQSTAYYVTLTWLPEILREEQGVSAALAGGMLALNQAVGIVSMFLTPVLAARKPSQRGVVAAAVGLVAAGVLGLLVTDVAVALWVALLGLGSGACFSLALTLFTLRAPDSEHASALSGMAQTVGYTLAAAGPLLFGALRDATGAWRVPLALLLVVAACLLITGLGAARDAHVSTREHHN